MKLRAKLVKAAALFSLFFAAWLYWHVSYGPAEFNRTLWLQGASLAPSDNPRLRMADGLVDSGILQGKSKAEVVTMLGQPNTTRQFGGSGLVYLLGKDRGLGIDSEWLSVDFAANGRVSGARIVRD